MKKLFKIAGVLVGLLVVLIVAAVLIVPAVFDPNDYKSQIAEAVKDQTGRILRIDGDIVLSMFPWLGMNLGAVELGNASGFPGDYFARSRSMQVRVKLMPLIDRQVEMDTVRIDGLSLNLAKDKKGRTNWDDLVEAGGGAGAEPGATPVVALAIGGVELRDADIAWRDAQAGTRVKLDKLALNTGPVALDAPLALDIEFDVKSDEPGVSGHVKAAGRIGLDAATQVVTASGLKVDASLQSDLIPGGTADLSVAADAVFDQKKQAVSLEGLEVRLPAIDLNGTRASLGLSGNIEGNLASGRYKADALVVEGKASGGALPAGDLPFKLAASLDADLGAQTLVVHDYTVTSGELKATGKLAVDRLLDAPRVAGKLAVAPFDARALLARLGQVPPETADSKALGAVALDAELAGSADSVSLAPFKLRLDDTSLAGSLRVENFQSPAVRLDLAGDALDVDRYLPPKSKTKAADPGSAAAAATGLPLDTLRALDVQAKLAMGGLTVAGLAVKDIKLGLAAKDGLIKLSPASAKLYGGTYKVSMKLDARGKQARIDIDERLSGVQVGRMLTALGIDTGDMDLSDAAGDLALDASVSGDPAGQVFDIKGATLKANVTGKALPGGRLVAAAGADLGLDLAGRRVSGRNVKLGVKNLKLPHGPTATGTVAFARLDADLAKQRFGAAGVRVNLEHLKLGPKAKPTSAKLSVARLKTDMAKQTLTADEFDLSGLGLQARGKIAVAQMLDDPQVAGKLDVPAFNPRKLLAILGQPPIETADPKALTAVSLKGTFNATRNSIHLDPISMKLDETRLEGTVDVADIAAPNGIRFDLKAGTLNADRYLPPKAKAQAATPGAAATALPLDLLRGLDVKGRLRVSKLVFSNLQFTDIKLNVAGAGGEVKLHPVNALLYGGSYAGNINVDARGKKAKLSVDEQLDRVHIGPLLKDLTRKKASLGGRGGVRIRATAIGASTDEMRRTLNGQAAVALRDGYIAGVDILASVCSFLSTLNLTNVSKDNLGGLLSGVVGLAGATSGAKGGSGRTDFSDLNASVNIKNGVANNQDLAVRSPLLRVAGRGDIDLVRERLDYLAEASLVSSCQGQGGLGVEELSDLTFPVRITGPLSDPKPKVIFTKELKTKVARAVSGARKKQPAGGQQPLQQVLPGIPLPGSGQQQGSTTQQPQKPKDQVEDVIKGLKGLFN